MFDNIEQIVFVYFVVLVCRESGVPGKNLIQSKNDKCAYLDGIFRLFCGTKTIKKATPFLLKIVYLLHPHPTPPN
jgi:hypothetical protein